MPSYGGTEPQWFGIRFTFRQLTHVMSPNGRTSSAAAVRMKNPAVHGVTECGHRRESANGRFVEAKLRNSVPPRAAALEQPEGPVWVGQRPTRPRIRRRKAAVEGSLPESSRWPMSRLDPEERVVYPALLRQFIG